MTKAQLSELDAKYKRAYDIEHMSDADYSEKYQPSGSVFGWALVMVFVLFAGWGLWTVLSWAFTALNGGGQ